MNSGRSISFTNLVSGAFSTLASGARPAAIYVLVVAALGVAATLSDLNGTPATSYFQFQRGIHISPGDGIVSALFQIAAFIASIVGGYLLYRAFLNGQGAAVDPLNRFWGYVGMMIVSTIGVALGFLLLIVPGIIIAVRWSASTGFLLGSGEGAIDSLRKSWDATRGSGWPIFFAALVLIIGYTFLNGFFGVFAGVFGLPWLKVVIAAVLQALGSVVTTALGVTVYLMASNQGERVSSVFD